MQAAPQGCDEAAVLAHWTRIANEYLALDRHEPTRTQVQELLRLQPPSAAIAQLAARFSSPLVFGTAGLRAPMGAGYARMNPLTVIQASQGLCAYLLALGHDPAATTRPAIVLGRDHRHQSELFAALTAGVFLSRGFRVHYYRPLVHTPLVPFGVRELGACCGVMITASHNPKQDNGYKVYWANGSQIIPPHDAEIAVHIAQQQVPWTWDAEAYLHHPLCTDPFPAMQEAYFARVRTALALPNTLLLPTSPGQRGALRFCYTPMHGVGGVFAQRVMSDLGLAPMVPVPEQLEPDPDFPTVAYPNPEEGKGALALAMATADRHGCQVILANDPDADRLAVAERDPTTGSWRLFTGNELGILLGSLVVEGARARAGAAWDPCAHALVTTVVSGRMLQRLAQAEGLHYEETLTGFKWMGNAADSLAQRGVHVLFAFEEAIGFMVGTTVHDKDGISALGFVAQQATRLYDQGCTLAGHLDAQYARLGYSLSETRSVLCHEPARIKAFFERVRRDPVTGGKGYATMFGPSDRITGICDLTEGYDSSAPSPGHVPRLPCSRATEMLTLTLAGGTVVTLRTSGTEPKVKCYCHVAASTRAEAEREMARVLGVSTSLLGELQSA